jgi:hypothetical protein
MDGTFVVDVDDPNETVGDADYFFICFILFNDKRLLFEQGSSAYSYNF